VSKTTLYPDQAVLGVEPYVPTAIKGVLVGYVDKFELQEGRKGPVRESNQRKIRVSMPHKDREEVNHVEIKKNIVSLLENSTYLM